MLTRIQINNFKAFLSQSLDLKPLTLLTGLNGMGKSSVFHALLLLKQTYEDAVLHPKKPLMLNGNYIELGTPIDALFEFSLDPKIMFEVAFSEGETEQSVQWHYEFNQEGDQFEGGATGDVSKISLFSDSFRYLQAERIGPRTLFLMSHDGNDIGTKGEFTAHFLSKLGRKISCIPSLLHPNEPSPLLFLQVDAWLGEISPGVRVEIAPYIAMDIVQMSMSYDSDTAASGQRFRPTNVGFGVTYVLPIVVAILSAKPGSLVLIENPEAHLHPKGQFKMGELIALAAQAGIQLLVETHSDHVLNGIRVAAKQGKIAPHNVAIHFFHRPTNSPQRFGVQVVSPRLDADGRLDRWPQDFFDEWDNALDQLL